MAGVFGIERTAENIDGGLEFLNMIIGGCVDGWRAESSLSGRKLAKLLNTDCSSLQDKYSAVVTFASGDEDIVMDFKSFELCVLAPRGQLVITKDNEAVAIVENKHLKNIRLVKRPTSESN